MVERDEFNEYGVKQSASKEKVKNSTNYSMIIIITVLFSIFNFVVGYMIGKFLGNPQKIDYVSSVGQDQYGKGRNLDSIVGLPSSNYLPKKDSRESVDVSDLEESFNDNIILENKDNILPASNPSLKSQSKTSATNVKSVSKQTSLSSKTSSSVSTKKLNSTSDSRGITTSLTDKAYYIQVSANENKNIAHDTLEKLKSMGIKNVSIINMSVGNKNVYRVRIGAFKSYEEASKMLEVARKVNENAFIVVSPK